jgi:serine/threonine protein kinase/serine/threonine protein phosphatase PrpC
MQSYKNRYMTTRTHADAPASTSRAYAPPARYVITRSACVLALAVAVACLRAFDGDVVVGGARTFEASCGVARGRRAAQEDTCAAFARGRGAAANVVAIFDGHDGAGASAMCARDVETLMTRDGVELEGVVGTLDDAFMTRVARDGGDSSGTTAVIVSSDRDGFSVSWVGDSAAYACSVDSAGTTRAEAVTQEHALSNIHERRRLDALGVEVKHSRGALRVGGEFLVTRAIGGRAHKHLGIVAEPQARSRKWKRGEVGVVLVSDGTIERMSADAVCAFVFAERRECGDLGADAIALGGDVGSGVDERVDAWDAVEFGVIGSRLNPGIARALKCALNLGSSDNVAIAAVSAKPSEHDRATNIAKRTPNDLTVADMPRVGARIAAYEITDMMAWSSGPFGPAAMPTLQYDYYELPSSSGRMNTNNRRTFEQSAIEGALAALALAPGANEQESSMFSAITSYIDVDVDVSDNFEEDPYMEQPFARGHFGEIWRAKITRSMEESVMDCKIDVAIDASDDTALSVILKRILVDQSEELRLSGAREVHFGKRLCGASPYLARFMHAFERRTSSGKDQWIVFKDEGESLDRLMYAPDGSSSGLQLVTQSSWWRDMRLNDRGRRTLKVMLKQIFTALDVCHAKFDITHRDIKPANIFVKLDGDFVQARIGDFGSAIDSHALNELYGAFGPSEAQETPEYSPPEVLFARVEVKRTTKYDIWSLGVLTTELLVLGSPKAFSQVSRKTRLVLERELRNMRPEARAVAYRLRAMLELCIMPPDTEVAPLLSWECTETALMDAFKLRDPLGVGFASVWELRLVRKLLSWDPSERPTAAQALEHAFFREDGRGWRCAHGDSTREFEWLSECALTCATTCT